MTRFYENSKKSILCPLWALFAHFRANKDFTEKSACHFFLFLDFYRRTKLQKKLMNKFREKLVTDVQTNGWMHGRTDGQAWIHRTFPSRGPKRFTQYRKKINSGLKVFLLLEILEKVSFNINMFRSLRVIASNIWFKKMNTWLFSKINKISLTNILCELHFICHHPLSTDYLIRTWSFSFTHAELLWIG